MTIGARRASATLLYLTTALVMGALELALLISGWTICAVLVITPLVVPALIGFQTAVAYVAGAEAWLARGLVGSRAEPDASGDCQRPRLLAPRLGRGPRPGLPPPAGLHVRTLAGRLVRSRSSSGR